jgi:hypothetical protein
MLPSSRSHSPRSTDHTPRDMTCSMASDLEPPFVFRPPKEPPPPRPAFDSDPATLLLGTSSHRPSVDLCVIHRLEEIDAEERTLDLALVTVIGSCTSRCQMFVAGSQMASTFHVIVSRLKDSSQKTSSSLSLTMMTCFMSFTTHCRQHPSPSSSSASGVSSQPMWRTFVKVQLAIHGIPAHA